MPRLQIQPSLESLQEIIARDSAAEAPPNLYPVFAAVSDDSLTPHIAYLKLANPGKPHTDPAAPPSFLMESAKNGDTVGRYSFIGTNPRKIIATTEADNVDPLTLLEEELSHYKQAKLPGLPPLSGGAVGYISYDCIKYFEPRTRRELKDVLKLPEAALMLFDTIVAFDFLFGKIQIVTNIKIDAGNSDISSLYSKARAEIESVASRLFAPSETLPAVPQDPIKLGNDFTSNVGQEGYESHVKALKEHIRSGDIIQAVPSQRVARPTSLHPFNIYRHLRTVNPSPYLFYMDFCDFQIVGASPELLVKSENGRIVTHPIAGTIRRGSTKTEDDQLAQTLLASAKDRAEHVMLVDLARNDINRVCRAETTSVDRLLSIERFSHVMHLVSQVSGVLRPEKTRFDAFRSVFPAGTVSGAPKVRAMELISELEGEKRGVYAGAVGHWGYAEEDMDTCIALRTLVVKEGVAYLQAGGGIVYDSDPYEEYVETMNKMRPNIDTIMEAEKIWVEKGVEGLDGVN